MWLAIVQKSFWLSILEESKKSFVIWKRIDRLKIRVLICFLRSFCSSISRIWSIFLLRRGGFWRRMGRCWLGIFCKRGFLCGMCKPRGSRLCNMLTVSKKSKKKLKKPDFRLELCRSMMFVTLRIWLDIYWFVRRKVKFLNEKKTPLVFREFSLYCFEKARVLLLLELDLHVIFYLVWIVKLNRSWKAE